MSSAIFGKGAQLQVEQTPGMADHLTISEVKSISGPTLEAEEVDVTNHDSPSAFREFVRGLVDAGELTFEINYNPADARHADLFADLVSGEVKAYKILFDMAEMPTISASYEMDMDAFVKSMPLNIPVDNVLTANLTLRITGAPTIGTV